MPKKAPPIAGPDLAGGPDFDLAQHKGSYVLVSFDGFPWCDPCKAELPHLLALAQEYAGNQSVPAVHVVIVNDRFTSSLSAVETFAKQEIVTIPVVDDEDAKFQHAYSGLDPTQTVVPQTYVVRPTGFLCEDFRIGAGTADELQALLIKCGAPAPGGTGVPFVELGSQPPPIVALIPAYAGWPPELPTPVEGPPQPRPKWLSLMSRQVLRALAVHDSAAGLADRETRGAVRKAALKSAAQDFKRLQKASALAAELGQLPPYVVAASRERKKTAKR